MRGAIYVNGAPVVAKEFRQASAVVWQRDILMPTATVREAIMTSAQLRLPQSMSTAEKRRRVDHIIAELVSWEEEGGKGVVVFFYQSKRQHTNTTPSLFFPSLRAWTTAAT